MFVCLLRSLCSLRSLRGAKNLLERQRRLAALSRLEQHLLAEAEFHADLEHHYGLGINHTEARFNLAGFRRACDEQRMLTTGKTFWQLYDIDKWAVHWRNLERARSAELAYFMARIPDSALAPLVKRVTELRREEQRAREVAYLPAPPTPRLLPAPRI